MHTGQENNASIDTSLLSIVVQGQVAENLNTVLTSLRRCFPGAEIILSTWEGSDVTGAECDKIVLSPDPGAVCCDEITGIHNNVNRQLVSTKAGLKIAGKPYILKTRTDIIFRDAGFLTFWRKYDALPSRFFQNRILICNYFTRSPRAISLCFHPSDWLVFGGAEDVRSYYMQTPLMTQTEGGWFSSHPKTSTFFTNYLCRYTPEQYIFINYLRRHVDVFCECYYARNREMIILTEQAFAECFVVLDYQKQLNIEFSKYAPNRYKEKYTLFSHRHWRAVYAHYCGKRFSLFWAIYCFQGSVFSLLTHLRTVCIKILDRLSLKETVKALLRRKL